MITPKFTVEQDEEFITVEMICKYIRSQDVEISIVDNELRFYGKPYFLRLYFSGNLVEDGRERAEYKIDEGIMTLKIPKLNKGEVFEDLDFLTKLLATKKEIKKPTIEVIDNEEDEDWEIEQTNEEISNLSLNSIRTTGYGFNDEYFNMFKGFDEQKHEILEIEEPEALHLASLEERLKQKQECEKENFDIDHYMFDFVDEEGLVKLVIDYETETERVLKDLKERKETKVVIEFTEHEKQSMINLPRKEYLLKNEKALYIGLVDILFAYCYEIRVNQGEFTVESSWCICKLSSCISNLLTPNTVEECVMSFATRAITFPLYRNWKLCMKIKKDVAQVLSLGRKYILKVLLSLKTLFEKNELCYLVNHIWIHDYCVWIQKYATEVDIKKLAAEVHAVSIKKSNLEGYNLEQIEALAKELENE